MQLTCIKGMKARMSLYVTLRMSRETTMIQSNSLRQTYD